MPPNHEDVKYHQKEFEEIPKTLDEIGKQVVHAAYLVHKSLGPGLLEKVYEICFCHELKKVGLQVRWQIDIPINYDGIVFEEGLRLDVLVEEKIICEIKAADVVNPLWEAQIISRLKLTSKRLGYLINFNVVNIGQGIKTFYKMSSVGFSAFGTFVA